MTEREQIEFFEIEAEKAYQLMSDASSSSDATARYSDAKEALFSAIGLARACGDETCANRLAFRLDEIKAVFRSQFS